MSKASDNDKVAGLPKAHKGIVIRDRSGEVKPKISVHQKNTVPVNTLIGLPEGIKIVRQAMSEKKVLSFTYAGVTGEITSRSIEPYKLIARAGKIMLYGYCLDKDAVRVFNLSNASDYQIQTFTFEPRWPIEDLLGE